MSFRATVITALLAAPLFGAAAPAATQAPADAAACAALPSRAPADVRVTRATAISANETIAGGRGPAQPIGVAFCRVEGVIEAEIGFELWLPLGRAWNGKFLGAGVGGAAGMLNTADMRRGVARGYAAASTDTGHKASDATWMLGDPIRLANYEHRANHLLAVKAKEMIRAFYGAPPHYSYFTGCSGGGRQGLKEMQLYPGDYDGIISGANGPDTPAMTTRRMWELILRDSKPGLMTPADWKLIADKGIEACDGLDGVKDGVAEDPRVCRFDVRSLQCRGAKTATCLSAEQVSFARQFYEPMRDSAGRALDQGLLPGVLVDSGRSQLAPATFGQAIRRQANWQGEGFDVGRDLAAIDRVMPNLRADKTDLSAFRMRGGKVIMYSGWMDPAVAGRMMTDYYDKLVAAAGGEAASAQFARLYMMPGVFHCGGGPGPDQVGGRLEGGRVVDPQYDFLTALEQWVEQGRAPGAFVASKVVDGKTVRTRPICPYPAIAMYVGKGSTDEAQNFVCTRPR